MTMTRDALCAKVQDVFRDVFDDDALEITDSTSAADIEDWDSLMHVTLVVALEKALGIKLKPTEIAKLENVGGMLDLFMQRLA